MRSRSRFVLLAALMALVAFGSAVTENTFVHTDDGCAVEQHCLACRLAVSGAVVLVPTLSLAPSLAPAGFAVVAASHAPRETAAADAPSRAPPLS